MEGTSRSRLSPDNLFIEVFSVINHQVASVALLDLSTSNGTLSRTSNQVIWYRGVLRVGNREVSVREGLCQAVLTWVRAGPRPVSPVGSKKWSSPGCGRDARAPSRLLQTVYENGRPYTKMAYFHFREGGMKCWIGSCDFAHAHRSSSFT